MEDWTPSKTKPGYLERTIRSETCIHTVLRPILTEEEREKRLKRVKAATEALLRSTLLNKKGKKTT